jgi:hypothetical protein
MIYLLILVAIFLIWSVVGYLSSRVEQAEYRVVEKRLVYEIREYAAHIEAQTTMQGNYDEVLSKGFRIIASYIFGGNSSEAKVAMTAPVITQSSSMKIAMTAPVVVTGEKNAQIISFVMPRTYKIETLPTPNDSRVKLVEIPSRKVAALRFSWYRTQSRIDGKKKQLLSALTYDNVTIVGVPAYAGYSAPWTPPWLLRSEILVTIT